MRCDGYKGVLGSGWQGLNRIGQDGIGHKNGWLERRTGYGWTMDGWMARLIPHFPFYQQLHVLCMVWLWIGLGLELICDVMSDYFVVWYGVVILMIPRLYYLECPVFSAYVLVWCWGKSLDGVGDGDMLIDEAGTRATSIALAILCLTKLRISWPSCRGIMYLIVSNQKHKPKRTALIIAEGVARSVHPSIVHANTSPSTRPPRRRGTDTHLIAPRTH